jgi:pimeloyl-ACP methyl ester carboxylesterase
MTLLYDLGSKFITVDGRKVRYIDAGSGPPLVLVHALGVQNSADQWLTNFDELTRVRHVYALDLPGWGYSDPLPEPAFEGWVAAIKGVYDATGIGQADLLGQSLGGWIAGLFAYQYPELVRRYAWLAQAGMNPNAPMTSATFRLPTRENLEKLYATPALGGAIYDQMITNPDREAIFKKMLDYINADEIREGYGMRKRLPEMKMPILFGNGDSNRAIPIEHALEGFRLAPNGRLVVAMGGSAPGGYNSAELVGDCIRFFLAEEIPPA